LVCTDYFMSLLMTLLCDIVLFLNICNLLHVLCMPHL